MEQRHNEYFDLPALLKQGDLNIRRFAEDNPMPVEEYFGKLSKFIILAPDVSIALKRFIKREGDKDYYRSLDDMAALLKELKCDKFVTDIYSILGAYERGNWRLSAVHAERIEDNFFEFYSKILASKRSKKPEKLHDSTLSLKEYILWLDQEETNRKLLIIAVDDSPVILESVSSVLSDDYKVFTLPKPKMLESVLRQMTPELFLLDYQMPELNGFELIPIIRSFEEHKETPIIFLTSMGTIDNVTAALALGASDYVVKPFKPETLREKIARHIVRKKMF